MRVTSPHTSTNSLADAPCPANFPPSFGLDYHDIERPAPAKQEFALQGNQAYKHRPPRPVTQPSNKTVPSIATSDVPSRAHHKVMEQQRSHHMTFQRYLPGNNYDELE